MKEMVTNAIEKITTTRTRFLVLVFCTNALDNILLTSVVPILPEEVIDMDKTSLKFKEVNDTKNELEMTIVKSQVERNVSLSFTKRLMEESYVALDADSKVGLMLSSKALIQILANPCAGYFSHRYGSLIVLATGTGILLCSAIEYSFAGSYLTMLFGRLTHGIGSACCSIAGMSLLADWYPSDDERSKVMGFAMGGVAFGVVVGYPFGGFLYAYAGKTTPFVILSALLAVDLVCQLTVVFEGRFQNKVKCKGSSLLLLLKDPYIIVAAGIIMFTTMSMALLEPTIPIWIIETMHAPKWQLGLVFLPDSLGYLIGTNCFGVAAKELGRWICSMFCMLLIGFCLICVPFSTDVTQLILPHFGIGLGLGITDAAIMPLLALLVDTRHSAVYESVYAIAQFAVCLAYGMGPSIGGQLVKAIGFPGLMWSLGGILIATSPACFLFRSVTSEEESKPILWNILGIDGSNQSKIPHEYERLYNDD